MEGLKGNYLAEWMVILKDSDLEHMMDLQLVCGMD
jgi:hypothetical protein